MLDRIIAILGLGITIISAAYSQAPSNWPKVPSSALLIGVLSGFYLLGCATGLYFSSEIKDSLPNLEVPKIVETHLSLQFHSTNTVPSEAGQSNIKFWYALYTESIFVDTKDTKGNSLGGFSIPARWNVFIIFEKPPLFRQMIATCTGPNSPVCDVQVANSAYSIIYTRGDLTNAIMNISTH